MEIIERQIDEYFKINNESEITPSHGVWSRIEHQLEKDQYKRRVRHYRFISIAAVFVSLIAVVSILRFQAEKNMSEQHEFTLEEMVSMEMESDLFFQDVLYLSSLESYKSRNTRE